MRSRRASKILAFLMICAGAGVASAQTLYWDNPFHIKRGNVRFSQSASGGGLLAVCWQELAVKAGGQGDIYISLAVSRDAKSWTTRSRFYGPIPYTEPDPVLHPAVYSLDVDGDGRILIAVTATDRIIKVIESRDEGKSFTEAASLQASSPAVTPGLFSSAHGGFLLFVTESGGGSKDGTSPGQYLSLRVSMSPDGESWSDFAPFVTETDLRYNLQPQHASYQGTDYVVFQSRSEANTYQLYVKKSPDGGAHWDAAHAITRLETFSEGVGGEKRQPIEFSNQRPFLAQVGNRLGLAWERSLAGSRAQVYYCEISESGDPVPSTMEKISSAAESIFGQVLVYNDGLYVLYADNSLATSRISLARKTSFWDTEILSDRVPGASQYPHGLVFSNQLILFWETGGTANASLVELRPVTSVDAPVLAAVDFKPDERSARAKVTIQVKDPPDPAGIKVYRYAWSLNGARKLAADVTKSNPTVELPTDADGAWEFSVTAEDYAGNISPAAKIGFIRDTTPPGLAEISPPPVDENGFLSSNTFTLSWSPPPNDVISRFVYGMLYLGPDTSLTSRAVAPLRTATASTSAGFDDIDDGLWAFSLAAVDTAGNVGLPATVILKLDKFVPYTAIYGVNEKTDEIGNMTLLVAGRGFATGGTIEKIALSRSGKPPYDYEFESSKGDFKIVGDRVIDGPTLTFDIQSGDYYITLFHSTRGPMTWKGGRVGFQAPGTIKLGPLYLRWAPGWIAAKIPHLAIPTAEILVVAVVVFIAVLIAFSARRIFALAREGMMLREEVTALIEGRPSVGWEERNRKMRELQKKGVGLRLKYTLLMIILVIFIVLIVSVPLIFQMIGNQRNTLALGLQKRSEILVDSIARSAENVMKTSTYPSVDIALVPNMISAMGAEAQWATITGWGETDQSSRNYVWATNNADWLSSHSGFRWAMEKDEDALNSLVASDTQAIEEDAKLKIEPLVRAGDADFIKNSRGGVAAMTTALEALQSARIDIDKKIKADSVFSWVKSDQEFDPNSLKPVYIFYKPIVFVKRSQDNKGNDLRDANGNYVYTYFQGMVRLSVSTKQITDEIIKARNTLMQITGLYALVAIGLGVLGAILLASITVTPIKRLAKGVAIIRDTEDKKELTNHTIEVRTRDEIGMLADTVNEMTKGLVKAAIANEELMVGKDVQKMFLPLEKGAASARSSTGGEETPLLEIYGYYEGAKGVSGDYFDFKKLDDIHYALIKCDVAGKGVPAALIMVEVATLFISYFRDWKKKKEDLTRVKDPAERTRLSRELERVDTLVYTINDMIEERAFKARFAALTVCLFNAQTGIATICNAGDRTLHVYESDQRRMVDKQLTNAPAAGVFPSMMVDMKEGFGQSTQKLDPGDAMFLYTDGFTESKRYFRDQNYKNVTCDEPGLKTGEIHLKTHAKGDEFEEFDDSRIEGVIDAVFNRDRYNLARHHSPTPGEELVFDFSTCQGTVKEAVLALVAVEKVYRTYRDPSADSGSRVMMDSKVDAFLKDHFLQYQNYFSHRMEGQDGDTVGFTHLKEDEQYDDLTIIVLRKK